MRWIMALLAVLSTVFLFMPILYRRIGHVSRYWRLAVKMTPTLMCAAFAGTAYFTSGELYSLFIFIGLCICAAADVLLGIHFITGGALFFAGHMFYITSFCIQQPPTWWSLPAFAVMLGLLWLFLHQFRAGMSPKMVILVRIYSAALAVVLCLSLPMPFLALSERTLLAALGALIFVLSDMGVCHGMLCKISRRRDACYLGIYYLAQLLLGLSAFGG